MPTSRQSGQASAEYVGVVALVAIVVAAATAGVAAAAPGLRDAIVHHARIALCIVGGDVCRQTDATAMGLDPCDVLERHRDQESGLSFVLREYAGGAATLRRRSDGRWILTAAARSGGTAGKTLLDAHLNGVGTTIAEVGVGTRLQRGSEWELTDAQVRRIRHVKDLWALNDPWVARQYGLPEPVNRYEDGAVIADFSAGLALGEGRTIDLASAHAELLLGRRRGRDGDGWYFRPSASLSSAPGDLVHGTAEPVAEYRGGAHPALVVRSTATAGDRTDVEEVVTLPLTSEQDRRLASQVLADAFDSEPSRALGVRRLRSRLSAAGLRERRTYRSTSSHSGVSLEILGFGFDHRVSTVRRELVDAQVTADGRTVKRLDCLQAGVA